MMDVDGLRIPLEHLPVSFAGLEVVPLTKLVEAHPTAEAKVGLDLCVGEDDFALSPFEYTIRVLAPAEYVLSRAVDVNDRTRFVGVSFSASEGRLVARAYWLPGA